MKAANFTVYQWNHGCKVMAWEYIQHIVKENLLLPKDLLELWGIKSTNTWLKYQKICLGRMQYRKNGEETVGTFYEKEL